jgi:hypothetical protein
MRHSTSTNLCWFILLDAANQELSEIPRPALADFLTIRLVPSSRFIIEDSSSGRCIARPASYAVLTRACFDSCFATSSLRIFSM